LQPIAVGFSAICPPASGAFGKIKDMEATFADPIFGIRGEWGASIQTGCNNPVVGAVLNMPAKPGVSVRPAHPLQPRLLSTSPSPVYRKPGGLKAEKGEPGYRRP
jgi:hypothetical protein